MSVSARVKPNTLSTGILGLTGAAPQTGAGASFLTAKAETGTLSARVYALATTNLLTITGKWQVADDGVTWRDAYLANSPANVVLVTGTGSAVTTTREICAPCCVYGHLYARFVVTSGAASGGGAGVDEYSIAYSCRTAL